ncbi:hypothetical protein H4Q26_003718 [Puccinia striiformis f. sp. tritici PST-130]|nr:hypothetical protein H4Q26_003718 [Puccinia striiformis f. sp. tritici PST-130]
MWPEYDHLSEVALDAIDAQAAICETLTRDKICAAADEAILAEFGDLSIPATVLSSEEERFPEDSVDADREGLLQTLHPPALAPRTPTHEPGKMTRQTPQTQKRHRRKSPSPSISSVERLNANTQPPASDDAMIDDHNSLTQADNPDTSQHSTTGQKSCTV